MKRIALGVMTVAGALVAVAIVSASGSAQTSARILRVFESDKGSTFQVLDRAPKIKPRRPRLSVGDMLVSNSPVFNHARKRRLGSISIHCTTETPGIEAKTEQLCTAALRLNDGLLTLTAAFRGQPVRGAVTGGTDAYAGAGGTFVSTRVRRGSEDTITLLP